MICEHDGVEMIEMNGELVCPRAKVPSHPLRVRLPATTAGDYWESQGTGAQVAAGDRWAAFCNWPNTKGSS